MHRRISLAKTTDLPELIELIIHSPSSFEKGFSVITGAGQDSFPEEFRTFPAAARSYILGLDSADRPVFLCISPETSDEVLLELLRVYQWQKQNPWVLPLLFGHGIPAGKPRTRFALASVSFGRDFTEIAAMLSDVSIELFELRVAVVDDAAKYPAFCPVRPSVSERRIPESLPAFLAAVEPEKLRNFAMRITGRIPKLFPGASFAFQPGSVSVSVFGKNIGNLRGGRGFLEFSGTTDGGGSTVVGSEADADAVLARMAETAVRSTAGPGKGILTPDEIKLIKGS